MSSALLDPPDLAGNEGGLVARRAVIRWAWRLFRREWRQQLLVLGLLTAAVAATVGGASVVLNIQLRNPGAATYGTAAMLVTLSGSDPRLGADITAVLDGWGPADLIESQDLATGTTQPVQLRAENPHGHYNAPMLGLVSGGYPAGAGQVALTSQVASLYGTHVGGTWQAAGTTWRVTGIVQNPSNLADEFALAAPGQVAHPSLVTVLLGSSPAVQQEIENGNGSLPGIPAATFTFPSTSGAGYPPVVLVLVVDAAGLVFIGLVSTASFSVMAQRRRRALGMLDAIGATERHLRLVMIAGGLAVGVAAALAGAALGLAAWFAYVPTVQRAAGHVIDATDLPWWTFAVAVVAAIATAGLASRRAATTITRMPVVVALSGRPAPPRPVHRSAVPGAVLFAVGLACLTLVGGPTGPPQDPLLLLCGLVFTIYGVIMLAPLAIGALAAAAHPRLPVAIRLALRDLGRYRARSGAALAATTFAVFLATGICLIASIKIDDPLKLSGPNLSGRQLIVYTQNQSESMTTGPSAAQVASLGGPVDELAASLHAGSAVPLESAGARPYQVGAPTRANFVGAVYVATPQLLAAYGIKASQIAPGTDILTTRLRLAGLPHLEMYWDTGCQGSCHIPGGDGGRPCVPSNGCVAAPATQTVSSLPAGTSAPNTVITEYAVRTYHLRPQLSGWLIQAPTALTAAQVRAARQFAIRYGVIAETRSGAPDPGQIAGGATALGMVIALGVLAATVGLLRSESARDLRTLTATGAGSTTRRTITAATVASLGLLGAILGMLGAAIAGLAWAHSSLSAMFGHVPPTDVLTLLIGLPLIAALAGWLLAGREPHLITRQPID